MLKHLKSFRYDAFYSLILKPVPGLVRLGQDCAWHCDPQYLNSNSFVVSAGVGGDISFEIELKERFGSTIVLLDPSPTGLKTIEKEKARMGDIVFLPQALSTKEGQAHFSMPIDSQEGSFRYSESKGKSVSFESTTLKGIMDRFGKTTIDLLKIDIEGFEYEVIRSIVKDRIPIRQICVEFHHGRGFPFSRWDTIRAIFSLKRLGYDLVHRTTWDHLFIHRSAKFL